jgi:anaerobic magnesium-protoporphyrin IX monomethyl ester cyclase
VRYQSVYVVNPPSPPGYISNKDSMGGFGQLFPLGATLFPPLDLVYLGSYLLEKGLPAQFLESLAMDLDREKLIDRIIRPAAEEKPCLVVVRTSAPTLDSDLETCREIRKSCARVEILIYGPVVPTVAQRIQKEPAIDYIVKGDPDETVADLITNGPREAAGLNYRNEFGWFEGPAKPFTKDLDNLPFPKWELLPYQKYQMPKSSVHANVPFLPMWTSRGCPIGCHYCPYPVGQGLRWRHRSAVNVVDEIEHLVRDLGIRYIVFRDPMFSFNQRRVIDICELIVERGIKVEWRCETRVDYLNEATLAAMARAGCEGINFGVESSDVAIQKGVGRRPIAAEQFIDCVTNCRRLGIKTFAFFIIGLPGDTVRTILQTIGFAIRIKPDWVQFTAASPFIGTKLRAWAVSQGFAAEDEYAYINSHEVWMGNDHLSKTQVKALYHFAKFFQTYLLNRKGILKQIRPSAPYRAMKWMADRACDVIAVATFRFGSFWFERTAQEASR